MQALYTTWLKKQAVGYQDFFPEIHSKCYNWALAIKSIDTMQSASAQAIETLKREIVIEAKEIQTKKAEHTKLQLEIRTVETAIQQLEHQQAEKQREIGEMQKQLEEAMKKK